MWILDGIVYALKAAPIWLSTERFQEPIALWFMVLLFLIVAGLSSRYINEKF